MTARLLRGSSPRESGLGKAPDSEDGDTASFRLVVELLGVVGDVPGHGLDAPGGSQIAVSRSAADLCGCGCASRRGARSAATSRWRARRRTGPRRTRAPPCPSAWTP